MDRSSCGENADKLGVSDENSRNERFLSNVPLLHSGPIAKRFPVEDILGY